jgi:hypothetical protein
MLSPLRMILAQPHNLVTDRILGYQPQFPPL